MDGRRRRSRPQGQVRTARGICPLRALGTSRAPRAPFLGLARASRAKTSGVATTLHDRPPRGISTSVTREDCRNRDHAPRPTATRAAGTCNGGPGEACALPLGCIGRAWAIPDRCRTRVPPVFRSCASRPELTPHRRITSPVAPSSMRRSTRCGTLRAGDAQARGRSVHAHQGARHRPPALARSRRTRPIADPQDHGDPDSGVSAHADRCH